LPAGPDPRATPQFQLKHAARDDVHSRDAVYIHQVAAMHTKKLARIQPMLQSGQRNAEDVILRMAVQKDPNINGDASRQNGTLIIASNARLRAHFPAPNGYFFSIRNTAGVSAIHG
jgi:hypothetical protein